MFCEEWARRQPAWRDQLFLMTANPQSSTAGAVVKGRNKARTERVAPNKPRRATASPDPGLLKFVQTLARATAREDHAKAGATAGSPNSE